MGRRPQVWTKAVLTFSMVCGRVVAGGLAVPNASFESPSTSFVSVFVDSWQEASKPDWYSEDGGFLWTQLMGLFVNPAEGQPDRVTNLDGRQALWLFAVPEVAVFQDYETRDWNDGEPSHGLDVTFRVGWAYELTVGVLGGLGGMLPGASLELSLYYLDGEGERRAVGSTAIVHSPELFPVGTRLVDFQVRVPVVRETDPWAGRKLGIRFLSTVGLELQGGYWDVDHVRLVEVRAPRLQVPVVEGGRLVLTFEGEPGRVYELLGAAGVTVADEGWTVLGTTTNSTGTASFSEGLEGVAGRFYRVREQP